MPWAPNARAMGLEDVPAQVRIVRSNLLFVSKEGLSAAAIDRIRRVAAFGNPDFYRAQAGISYLNADGTSGKDAGASAMPRNFGLTDKEAFIEFYQS